MPDIKKAISVLVTTQAQNVDPASVLNINVNGVGQVVITFATQIPPSLQQYAVSSNSVVIPVHGSLNISGLNGILQVIPVNVTVNIQQQITGVVGTTPKIQIEHKKVKHVTVTVSNNTVSSANIDGVDTTPTTGPLTLYTGSDAVQISGYGVQFTIGDYDPVANVPTGAQIPVTLLGNTSQYAEAFMVPHRSSTGYIIIQNISGNGQFNIFTTE